jgi:glutathione S-transferase
VTTTHFKPKAYLKDGCPYSFKYLLFMSEAGLVDRIDVVRCDPDSADFDKTKDRLARATGREATFPTVEIEPGRYLSDSDQLIDHFARVHTVDPAALPALSFYKETVFPQLTALHE